jgi:hypothetical protein
MSRAVIALLFAAMLWLAPVAATAAVPHAAFSGISPVGGSFVEGSSIACEARVRLYNSESVMWEMKIYVVDVINLTEVASNQSIATLGPSGHTGTSAKINCQYSNAIPGYFQVYIDVWWSEDNGSTWNVASLDYDFGWFDVDQQSGEDMMTLPFVGLFDDPTTVKAAKAQEGATLWSDCDHDLGIRVL